MTIVVTSIVAIPLSLMLSQHMVSVFVSKDYTMAVNLARFEMEIVNNMNYANIAIGTINVPNYQGYNYDVARTVTFNQGNSTTPESLKKIQVDVKKSGSAIVLVSLVTYRAANVNYGL